MAVNKWLGIGNLTADPEIRYSEAGTAMANLSLACNESYTDKAGKKQERTEFVRVVTYGRLAEICGEYLHKGKQIYIEGRLHTRSYSDREGIKRYVTEVIASNMQMLGPAKAQKPKAEPTQKTEKVDHDNYVSDDDIPF